MPPRPLSSPDVADAAPRSLGRLSQLMGFRLRRIQNHLSRTFAARPEFQGHKPGQLSVLALMSANPGLSQIELATEVGLDKAILVSMLDELEGRGWVRRERAPEDRRRNLLFVTDEGEATLDRWAAIARENEEPVRQVLSAAEFAFLSELLDRIYNQCFNHDEE
jgi:DNA-binding MarR family transcriptional regulator